MRTFWGAALGAVIGAAAAGSPGAAQEPPPPLRLDVDRHVDALLARHGTKGLPRFEETIDVVERAQPALDKLLADADLACGPTSAGPPQRSDLNAYRGATIPVHIDFLAPGKLLWEGLSRLRHPKPKWFLYRVHRGDAGQFVLREGEAPAAERYAATGTTWEEVARFRDRDGAVAALRRLEHGFATAERRTNGEPLPPWVATTCRPPGLR